MVLTFDKLKIATGEAIFRFNTNRILRVLNVRNSRYDEVLDASPFTYQWIYDDHGQPEGSSSQSEMPEEMIRAKDNIRSWLSTGSGILHIAGKPGAGKSTLMKFITKHEQTRALLHRWTGSESLVVVKFFFWKRGDWRQNTLRGLKQSIVAQILEAVPELSRDLFPRQYQTKLSIDLLEDLDIGTEDMSAAFDRLLGFQRHRSLAPYKVCLFLDGLDEFEEAAENINHSDLARQMMGWIEASNGQVKACVSSRQLPAFESIHAVHRIRLQDITFRDMLNHINGTLMDDISFQHLYKKSQHGCGSMMKQLANRADGVFLWVSLVIKSIQRGLSNHDPLEKLQARILETPRALEGLFERILHEIDQDHYRKEVYILLAIVLAEEPRNDYFKLRTYDTAFVSLFAAGCLFTAMDSGLTLDQTFQRAIAGPYQSEEYDSEFLTVAETQVSGRCLGLLEVANYGQLGRTVEFLHRSIPEYLERHTERQLTALGISRDHILNVMAWMVSRDAHRLMYTSFPNCYSS